MLFKKKTSLLYVRICFCHSSLTPEQLIRFFSVWSLSLLVHASTTLWKSHWFVPVNEMSYWFYFFLFSYLSYHASSVFCALLFILSPLYFLFNSLVSSPMSNALWFNIHPLLLLSFITISSIFLFYFSPRPSPVSSHSPSSSQIWSKAGCTGSIQSCTCSVASTWTETTGRKCCSPQTTWLIPSLSLCLRYCSCYVLSLTHILFHNGCKPTMIVR